jgi:hypothetical protein
MNRGLWIARKNYLSGLIRKYAKLCKEDDVHFVNLHIAQTIDAHPGELIENAIDCYLNLIEEKERYGKD